MPGNKLCGYLALWLVGFGLAANPERDNAPGHVDCNAPVGFSLVGIDGVVTSGNELNGLIKYRTKLSGQGVSFGAEGIVTFVCPGLYQISFSAYSEVPNTTVELRIKKKGRSGFGTVVGAGGGTSGGGFNSVLIDLEGRDAAGIWLGSGNPTNTSSERRRPASTFTAFRVARS